MITQLKNPLTTSYKSFKEYVLGDQFPWFWWEESTKGLNVDGYDNFGFFSHSFLTRPGENGFLYSRQNCQFLNNAHHVFLEIIKENDIKVEAIHRMNANCIIPTKEQKYSSPHVDHEFPHKNCLIYMTNAGGNLCVFGEDGRRNEHSPKEDDIIMFDGNLKHCPKPPKQGRRISIVITYS